MEEAPSEEVPVTCALPPGDFDQRLAWIAALNRTALLRTHRDGRRLILTYGRSQAGLVHEMVDRERQCCGFLSFEVTKGQDSVTLVIEAPKEVADVLDTVFAPFLAGTPEDGGCTCCGPAGTE